MNLEDVFARREMRLLQFAVTHLDEHIDDMGKQTLTIEQLVEGTGLDEADVKRALRSLYEASPPYIEGITVAQMAYPIRLTNVTERARREAGQWPTPEALVSRMVAALNEAADAELDPERKSKLKSAALALGGVGRDLAVQVAATVIASKT